MPDSRARPLIACAGIASGGVRADEIGLSGGRASLPRGDVHLSRGRWAPANPFAPRLKLDTLLAEVAPVRQFMLDLRPLRRSLAARVLEQVRGREDVTVCSRNWRLLEPFCTAGLPVVCSAGSRRLLGNALRRLASERPDGVSIRERLLTRSTVTELPSLTELVLTRTVNSLERARELVQWGVLITDDPPSVVGVAPAVR